MEAINFIQFRTAANFRIRDFITDLPEEQKGLTSSSKFPGSIKILYGPTIISSNK